MVGPGDVVADDLRRVPAHEDGARVAHAREQRFRRAHAQLEMLGGQAVGQLDRSVQVLHQDHRAVLLDRLGGDGPTRESRQLVAEGRRHARDQSGRVGDQQRAGHRIVLGLGQEIGGQPLGIGRIIGDDRDLAGPGHHVDADLAEHLALGQRHVDVAGTDDLVHAADGGGAVRQRGDRLRPTDPVALGDPGHAGRGQDGRIDPAVGVGRRHQDDLPHPGDSGRDDRHQHGGRVGRAAAGNVDADPVERAHLLPQHRAVLVGDPPGLRQGRGVIALDALGGVAQRLPHVRRTASAPPPRNRRGR